MITQVINDKGEVYDIQYPKPTTYVSVRRFLGCKPGGNEGEIWSKNEHGNYTCDSLAKRNLVLSQEDIDHDVDKGFLKEIEE